ncbi:tape measure chaperone [Bacillus phage SWEP1]|nr:tape measure chaperone [Bacillus phage SWEP1]
MIYTKDSNNVYTIYKFDELSLTARKQAYKNYLAMYQPYYTESELLSYIEYKHKAIRETLLYYSDGTEVNF